jgi:hypothetical protein
VTENESVTENPKTEDDILAQARKRFDLASQADSDIHTLALEDLKFAAGEQWPEDVKGARELDSRPCLTINRLPQAIHQITNDQRQNRPSIKVSPVDDKADIQTAKILQGLVRHIEYASDADTAYDTAFDSAVRASFGYFRITTEYCDPYSFDLEARIERVADRFSVRLDPYFTNPDGSDANWGFIFENLSADDYKAKYPNSKLSKMEDWESVASTIPGWATKDSARVAEYFYREFEEKKIAQIFVADPQTGQPVKHVLDESEIPEGFPESQILAKRSTLVPTIKWCKTNGIEILEETIWPGKWIPIIPVLGEEQIIDGKRVLKGLVRDAKDPQRMYNYWASAETETIALAPRAPWIGAEGQFEGHEEEWATANTRNHAKLEYKPKTIGGVPVGPPQRNAFEPPVQAISQARMLASDDLKATTGIYDAALGAQAREVSGVAIRNRANQSQTSNFHFFDNLSKSIRHGGRILVDIIPKIYDTERAVRILGEDGTEEIVRINQIFEHKGKQVFYDLGAGKYDVTVNTGPSFETKRQEAAASMADLTKAYPQIMQVAGDLLVKNLDWPGAQEIGERLKKTLPAGVADDDKKQMPIPPQVQAQMQQMNQLIEHLTSELKHQTQIVSTKALELESRERIEMAKLQVQAEIEMAKMGSQEAQLLLKQEVSEIQHRLELLHSSQPIGIETEAGPNEAAPPNQMQQQPPTGGPSPGQPMGV